MIQDRGGLPGRQANLVGGARHWHHQQIVAFFAKDDCEEIVGVMTAPHPGPHKPAGLQADNIALTRVSSRLEKANHIINSIIMSFENQNAPQAAVFAGLGRLFLFKFSHQSPYLVLF